MNWRKVVAFNEVFNSYEITRFETQTVLEE